MSDPSPQQCRAIVEGFTTLGLLLRQWRAQAGLHAVSAQLLNLDGVVTVTCQPDDGVTVRDGDVRVDITELLDSA